MTRLRSRSVEKKLAARRRNAAPLDGRRSARKFAAEKIRSAACDPALEAASLGLARQPVAVVAAALLVASWSRCRPRRAPSEASRPRARRAAHVPLPAAVGVLASLAAARWRENRYAAACAPSSVASPTHPRCAPAAIIFDRYNTTTKRSGNIVSRRTSLHEAASASMWR